MERRYAVQKANLGLGPKRGMKETLGKFYALDFEIRMNRLQIRLYRTASLCRVLIHKSTTSIFILN